MPYQAVVANDISFAGLDVPCRFVEVTQHNCTGKSVHLR